ncbi:hypothetical protein HQQ81_11495 [Microbacteriaceae bacterium VKM Ac-2854]|nr:hypothetical protein [Microbacteriaceae bacterium VKM Ac-2854]
MTDENTTTTEPVAEPSTRPLDPRLVPLRSRAFWLRCLAVAGCGYGSGLIVALVAFLLAFAVADWKYFSGEMLLTGPVQIVAAATAGVLGTTISSSMAGGSIGVYSLPLAVTAGIVIGLTVAARHRRVSSSERVATAIASGLILATGSTALAAICTQTVSPPSSIAASVSTFSIGAASVTGTLGATVLGIGATWLATGPVPWLRVLPVPALRSGLTFLTVVGGLSLAGYIVILLGSEQPAYLMLLPLAGPTFALDAAAFVTGGSLGTFGGLDLMRQLLASLDGGSAAASRDLSLWSGAIEGPVWLAILIPVVAGLIAAVLLSLVRTGRVATNADWFATSAAFAAIGLAVQLLPVIAVGYSFPLFGSGTVGGGPAAWTFLVFGAWGALVEAGARWLSPIMLQLLPPGFVARLITRFSAPASAAVAQPQAQPVPKPQPVAEGTAPVIAAAATAAVTPRRGPLSRRSRLIAGGIIAALVLGIGATVAGGVLRGTVFGPGATAQRYLDALEAGDATTALQLGGVEVTDQDVLLTDAAFGAATGRIRAAAIGRVEQDGDLASVPVTYRFDDETRTTTLTLTRNGTDLLIADRWTVVNAEVGTIAVTLPRGSDGRDLIVGDETLAMPDPTVSDDSTWLALRAFPGAYDIGLGATDYLEAVHEIRSIDPFVEDDSWSAYGLGLAAEPTPAFEEAAVAVVTDALTACAASTEAEPEECPFSVDNGWGSYTNVSYAIRQMPELELELGGGSWTVRSTNSGTVDETYDYSSNGGAVRHESTSARFSVEAHVDIVDGEVVLDSMR